MKRGLVSVLIMTAAFLVGGFFVAQTIFASNNTSATSSVTVGSAIPTVSGVALTPNGTITLNANGTTSISVFATIADNNGCTELTGTTSVLLYRNGVTSSSCLTSGGSAVTNLNCYLATAFTATSTCTGSQTSIGATTTFGVYYFAQATDGSSPYSGQGWRATVIYNDPSNATATADSVTSTISTLTAINVTTSSINYGSLQPTQTSTVATTTVQDVGNSSTTLQLNAAPTLNSSGNVIATSSQHYATSSFTYGGNEQLLSGSATAVPGFTLTAPSSTGVSVSGTIYWALQVPAGTATGTYTGTNAFTSVFSN